mmetsp:Transcript_144243/g.268777  ORF Transcript_144243/g.268777 Transcript_144243/m.268777 type:complete len:454 (+) Transcript_144243:56-1417(+)
MLRARLAVLAAAAASLIGSAALKVEGSIKVPANRIIFLSKFCFDYDTEGIKSGTWDLKFLKATPARTGKIELILFDDESFSYPSDEDSTGEFRCGSDKLKLASKYEGDMDAKTLPNFGKFQMPLVQKRRPRWWYVSLVDCSGEEHEVEFSLHMTNPKQGFQREMSMDQCGVRLLGLIFVTYAGLCWVQLVAIMMRSSARTKHPLRILVTAGAAAAAWGMFFLVGDTAWLLWKGVRPMPVYIFAKSLKACSKFIMMGILLLLSKGKGISRTLSFHDVCWVSKYLVPFFLSCLALELWGEYSQSRLYTTDSVYCTWIGGLLVCVDLLLCAFYSFNLYESYQAELEEERRVFYRKWGPWYAFGFLILPIAICLSLLISPWFRSAVVLFFTNAAHISIYASLIIGLWPERTQAFFCLDKEGGLANTFGREIELLDSDAAPLQVQMSVKNGPNGGQEY